MNRLILFLFVAATAIATLLTLAGYFGDLNFYCELASHFKVQYFIVGLIALIFFFIRRERWLIVLSLLCVCVNLAVILPWHFSSFGTQAGDANSLKFLVANVNLKNRNYPALIQLIEQEQPDIVAVIEVTQKWIDALEPIEAMLPYSLKMPDVNRFGIAMYSRLPFEAQAIEDWQRPSLVTRISQAEQALSVIATHPVPPLNPALLNQRNQQLETAGQYIQELQMPVVLLGDLNITMWSPAYQQFVQATGLKNSRVGFGVLPTWPTDFPILYIPIDHCLVSPEIQVLSTRRGPNIGSDHLPLITELALSSG